MSIVSERKIVIDAALSIHALWEIYISDAACEFGDVSAATRELGDYLYLSLESEIMDAAAQLVEFRQHQTERRANET